MSRPQFEIADVIEQYGPAFYEAEKPNLFHQQVLRALLRCRTSQMGYHAQACDHCGDIRISYNSCRNRHCPKCQTSRQQFWVEDLLEKTLPVKHYHMVFTVPHELNTICMLDSKWFYGALFDTVWDTLRTFGYTKYGVETGAVCVLHTWGQNLSLHPHIHCIVPSAGQTLAGKMKHIAADGKYIYPQKQLGKTYRGKLMDTIKRKLVKESILRQHQALIDSAWEKDWVVEVRPSFGKPEHVVKYLGQYTHRVAITNQRLLKVDEHGVTFMHKNYRKDGKLEPTHLSGVEFLRRFCQHILPLRFVKIRHYGIYSSRFKALNKKAEMKMTIKPKMETVQERILRLTGFDILLCPSCKIGRLHTIEIVPRIRSPTASQLLE